VIGTQQGGKPKIQDHDGVFIDISGIGVSAFPLRRSKALHIGSIEIVKSRREKSRKEGSQVPVGGHVWRKVRGSVKYGKKFRKTISLAKGREFRKPGNHEERGTCIGRSLQSWKVEIDSKKGRLFRYFGFRRSKR